MSTLLQLMIAAAVFAAAYSLVGIGYNLAYATMRSINFAQGQLYMLAAMVYLTLVSHQHWPIPLAFCAGLMVAGTCAVLIERLAITPVMRSRFSHSLIQASLLATVAIGIVIENVARIIWGSDEYRTPALLGSADVHVASIIVGADQLTAIGGAVVTLGLTWLFLQRTSVGLQIRAIAANPSVAQLQGIDTQMITSLSFFVSGMLGGIAGILVTPLTAATTSSGLSLSIYGLIAAGLMGMGNMRAVIPSAFLIGALQVLFSAYVSTLYGTDLALGVVLLVLVAPSLWSYAVGFWRRSGRARVATLFDHHESLSSIRLGPIYRRRSHFRALVERNWPFSVFALAATLVALLPLDNYLLRILTWFAVDAIAVVGFNLLFGVAGQMAFSHIFFFAIGAYVSAILGTHFSVPFALAGIAAIVVSSILSAVFGALLLRLQAFTLGTATLVMLTFIVGMAIATTPLSGGTTGLFAIHAPVASPALYFLLVSLIGVIAFWIADNLIRGGIGRAWRSIAENDLAAASLGIDVRRYKVIAYVVSSAYAAAAGWLFAPIFGYMSPSSFDLNAQLLIVMASVVGGMSTAGGALLGAGILIGLPQLLLGLAAVASLVYGVVLMAALIFMPYGVAGALRASWRRWRVPRSPVLTIDTAVAVAPAFSVVEIVEPTNDDPSPSMGKADGLLEVRDVVVRFGGLLVLDGVSLRVPAGRITGLIGPNGAGKTTLFNVISGVVRPISGDIVIDGSSLRDLPPHLRAARGICRTFQTIQVFQDLRVLENVMAGSHLDVEPWLLRSSVQSFGSMDIEEATKARANSLIEFAGISRFASHMASEVPYGDLKLLEIARALATRPRYLLVDEPAGGLDEAEIPKLSRMLTRIRDMGIGVLLVEHNVSFVLNVCEKIAVLDHGVKIAEGTSEEIRASAAVKESYLGRRPTARAVIGIEAARESAASSSPAP